MKLFGLVNFGDVAIEISHIVSFSKKEHPEVEGEHMMVIALDTKDKLTLRGSKEEIDTAYQYLKGRFDVAVSAGSPKGVMEENA